MLTDEDTYKIKKGTWKDFREKVESFPQTNVLIPERAVISRTFILEGGYLCNIYLYAHKERLDAFYIGTDKNNAKGLLEKALETELESVSEKDN